MNYSKISLKNLKQLKNASKTSWLKNNPAKVYKTDWHNHIKQTKTNELNYVRILVQNETIEKRIENKLTDRIKKVLSKLENKRTIIQTHWKSRRKHFKLKQNIWIRKSVVNDFSRLKKKKERKEKWNYVLWKRNNRKTSENYVI